MKRFALAAGIAVPFLYFGVQIVAAPFYPGYSFLANSASQLGSDLSAQPWILNTGAKLTGAAMIIAAFGFLSAMKQAGMNRVVAGLVFFAMLSSGAGAIWAGSFPLPDRRHNPGPVTAGMFLLPILYAIAFWKRDDARGVRTYLIANTIAFLLLVPIMSGVTGINLQGYGGLMQRVAAVIFHVPVAVVATFLSASRLLSGDSSASLSRT